MVLFLAAATEGDNGAEWSGLYPFGQDEGDRTLNVGIDWVHTPLHLLNLFFPQPIMHQAS